MSVGTGQVDLVEGTTGGERPEGVDEGDEALGAHACCDAHHVGLGDAALDELRGQRLLDLEGARGAA